MSNKKQIISYVLRYFWKNPLTGEDDGGLRRGRERTRREERIVERKGKLPFLKIESYDDDDYMIMNEDAEDCDDYTDDYDDQEGGANCREKRKTSFFWKFKIMMMMILWMILMIMLMIMMTRREERIEEKKEKLPYPKKIMIC